MQKCSANRRNGRSISGTTFRGSKLESENIYCQYTIDFMRLFVIHSVFWRNKRVSSILQKNSVSTYIPCEGFH